MQAIKNVIQLNDLSTRSGIAAKTAQIMTCPATISSTSATTMIPAPTSSTSADIAKHKQRIHKLFLRFAAIYGHVWKGLYKSDEFLAFTKNEWLDALKEFEDSSIDKALLNCRSQWEYPPSLPQFIEACKRIASKDKGFYTISPVQKGDPEIAAMYMKQIKTILNIK